MNDLESLFANTFLARVPTLVASGMSIDDAVVAAYDREQEVCAGMIGNGNYWQQEAVKEIKDAMCQEVYQRARTKPVKPAINPRWLECEQALGHKPTAHEFIMWHYAQRKEGTS